MNFHYFTAVELAGMLRAGELGSVELVEAQLRRIDELNPVVNAIVTLDADRALAEARRADEMLRSGAEVGPLHGLPVAFKDTHDTAGMRTTSGSPLFADHVPAEDALVVARMRAAGAIGIGKTNVPEFAAGSHTFNPVFGTTYNPYDLSKSAGGSSGGAAAALALGLVPLCEGSDMGGSLRNPASFCNVAGFRPSPGRVPSLADSLAWQTLAVAGPMGRTVADAALLLSAIAGPDARCPISLEAPGSTFAGPLDRDLRGLRVAWSPDLGGAVPVEPEVAEIVTAQAAVFESLGCEVEQACPDFAGADEAFRVLRAWSFAHTFGPLVRAQPERVKPSLVRNVEEGFALTGEDVARAEQLHTALFHRVREFFCHHDVLVLPTSQVPPFDATLEYPTEVAGVAQHSYLDWMRSAYFVTVTGSPALSVPAGLTRAGLPVGIQLVGPHRRDRLVLEVGHAFEAATGVGLRRPDPARLKQSSPGPDSQGP